jgi:hypothetical protein
MVRAFLHRPDAGDRHGKNKVPCCVAKDSMLRRSYAENAYLKSLFFHKYRLILVSERWPKADRFRAEMRLKIPPVNWGHDRLQVPVTLAPPKRSFQRGMTSRL